MPADGLEWLRKDYLRDSKALEPLLRAFRRLQPRVDVQISLLKQDTLSETLRYRSSRGLGPDLLLLRSPQGPRVASAVQLPAAAGSKLKHGASPLSRLHMCSTLPLGSSCEPPPLPPLPLLLGLGLMPHSSSVVLLHRNKAG